jgi:hypothetical protein
MRCVGVALVLVLLDTSATAQIGLYRTEDGNDTYCNWIEL